MSHDQAARLRSLAQRTVRASTTSPLASVRSIVVSSGERRLGGTTLAVHLSISFARQGLRVVLVDADLETAGASLLSRVPLHPGLTDVLSETRTIHEALQRGPAGIQVLAGSQGISGPTILTSKVAQRLRRQRAGLARHTDVVVLDVPCLEAEPRGESLEHSPLLSFWQHADDLVLVTSDDDSAIMNTYALLKSCWSRTVVLPRLHVAVNHAADEAKSREIHLRLDRSSRRFLQLPLEMAGWLPTSPLAASEVAIADAGFDAALEQMAQRLLGSSSSEGIRTVA